ncbi:MAG: hypothetical protein Harvfovirus18_6 [Harvfovirus sp.]|uniref:Uncharacterized protein n=1 Tax=Harvfovirus sp. TaxID=2487768 RepID=A0A3G5A1P2_9VIRU|nr:MAG: hypothetical protein Harvfovirus18_6 [Harvfovirus sp.]
MAGSPTAEYLALLESRKQRGTERVIAEKKGYVLPEAKPQRVSRQMDIGEIDRKTQKDKEKKDFSRQMKMTAACTVVSVLVTIGVMAIVNKCSKGSNPPNPPQN